MDELKIKSENYIGCLLGSAIGNAMGNCCRTEKKMTAFTSPLRFDGLMQLSLFTAEGLLRATHRAKLHGTNGTFAEIVYESYQRWLYTQSVDYNDLIQLPERDGWLLRRSELYHKGAPLLYTPAILKTQKMGEIAHPLNYNTDFEGMMRVAPVGLMFPGDEHTAFFVGEEVCALTHGASDAYLSAGFYASLISLLAINMPFTEAIEKSLAVLEEQPHAQCVKDAVIAALYFIEETEEESVESLSEVVPDFLARLQDQQSAPDLLSYALYCALRFKNDFRLGVLQSIRYPAAPHASGMLCGSILGLIHGDKGIPSEWTQSLKHADIVNQVAEDLLTGIKGDIFTIDREWINKYPGW